MYIVCGETLKWRSDVVIEVSRSNAFNMVKRAKSSFPTWDSFHSDALS